jgi:hypothetical protein
LTKLTIPSVVLPDVREGLLCLLGDATESIMHTLEQPEREYHPEWFHDDRRLLTHVLALLDLVGWDAGREPSDVQLDLAEHGPTLKDALEGYLPLLQERTDQQDRRRAEEGMQPAKDDTAKRLAVAGELIATIERHAAEAADSRCSGR